MLVGVPKEIKDNEYRVGIVPSTVRELADKGHRVVVESRAGAGAGFADSDYQTAGAEVVPDSDAIFSRAELIVKVKEPLATERKKLSRGQALFTYLHLAPDRQQTEALMAVGVTAIAYETVTSPERRARAAPPQQRAKLLKR
jgi:alanine dehydrogenase